MQAEALHGETHQPDASFRMLNVSKETFVALDDYQIKFLIKIFDSLPPFECVADRLQHATDVSITFDLGNVDSVTVERLKRELNALALVLKWLSDNGKNLHLTLIFGQCSYVRGNDIRIEAVAGALRLFPSVKSLTFELADIDTWIDDPATLLLVQSIKHIYRNSTSLDRNSLRRLNLKWV